MPRAEETQSSDPTLTFWQQRTSRKLSHEDAREIRENLSGFIRVLVEWRATARDGDPEKSSKETAAKS